MKPHGIKIFNISKTIILKIMKLFAVNLVLRSLRYVFRNPHQFIKWSFIISYLIFISNHSPVWFKPVHNSVYISITILLFSVVNYIPKWIELLLFNPIISIWLIKKIWIIHDINIKTVYYLRKTSYSSSY